MEQLQGRQLLRSFDLGQVARVSPRLQSNRLQSEPLFQSNLAYSCTDIHPAILWMGSQQSKVMEENFSQIIFF